MLSFFLIVPFTERTFAAPIPASVSAPANKAAEPRAVSEDPFGRGTPFGSVMGFLVAAEKEDYQRASEYLQGPLSKDKKKNLSSF